MKSTGRSAGSRNPKHSANHSELKLKKGSHNQCMV
jgi:hypothetical protein